VYKKVVRENTPVLASTKVHATSSIDIRGVGSKCPMNVGGRGPMVIHVRDSNGKSVILIDPEGVYVVKMENVPEFRILGQQRMKSFGCRLVQCYKGTQTDVIECMRSGISVPLLTENGILVVSTETNVSTVSQQTLSNILRGSMSALFPMERKTVTSMAMNPARLSPTCYARLMHWKLGHPAEDVPMKMDSGVTVKLNEDCFVCDQSKLKVKPFPKNDPSLHSSNPSFWRPIVMDMVAEERVHWKVHHLVGNLMKEQLVVSYSRVRQLERYVENCMQPPLNSPQFSISFFKMLKGNISCVRNYM
jgi:hypothetical protein